MNFRETPGADWYPDVWGVGEPSPVSNPFKYSFQKLGAQEQELSWVRWSKSSIDKKPVFPNSYICGQSTALWAHTGSQAASCWSATFLPGLCAHSTPSPGRQLLVMRAREQRNTTGRDKRKALFVIHVRETRRLVCWPHHRSRSWGRCKRSESKWKPTETTALNHPAQQEMFLRDLQRC